MPIPTAFDIQLPTAFEKPVDMRSNKITTMANGTDAGDAINMGQMTLHAAVTSGVHNFDISGNAPAQAHAIDGAKHTAAGLTAGHALIATNATTFGFRAIAEADVTNLVADLGAKAADNAVVHLAGVETVTWGKTFSSAANSFRGDYKSSDGTSGIDSSFVVRTDVGTSTLTFKDGLLVSKT